jgi:hypothetical protein
VTKGRKWGLELKTEKENDRAGSRVKNGKDISKETKEKTSRQSDKSTSKNLVPVRNSGDRLERDWNCR